MAYKRRITLGQEEQWALSAATSPPDQAQIAWESLMGEMPFDQVNENTQRIMPAIYRNLRVVPGLSERDRVRGAFKHRWSKNTRMLFDFRPVVRDLDAKGIDYRVIKGAAVQAVCGSMGARVMGDIDLLTTAQWVEGVSSTLINHGYRRSEYTACSGHSDSSHCDSLNFNKEASHIDVHVAEFKQPVSLLRLMMALPPHPVTADGISFAAPAPELLLLHAAVHGRMSSGPTDLMQALLDACLLRPYVDPETLLVFARRTGTLSALLTLDETFAQMGLAGTGVTAPTLDKLVDVVTSHGRGTASLATNSISITRRIIERKPRREALQQIQEGFTGRTRSYAQWVKLGKFASLERAVVRRWGGFLHPPQGACFSDEPVHPFREHSPGVAASTVAGLALDWRFRIKLHQRLDYAWLELKSDTLDTLDTFAFCNGVPLTRVVAGDPTTRVIGLRSLDTSLEISLRPLWHACESCYARLDDVTVTIHSRPPIR